jgi:lysozyme
MRLVCDISVAQTHMWDDWTVRRPYDLGAFGASVDAAWVRWTDWSAYVQWGADPDYALCINTLRDAGKPVGPYLFPRPGMSDPQTQIRAWRNATPEFTWAPMLDAEAPGGLSGPDISRWVDTALAEMTQQFQRIPWLYTNYYKVTEWGMSRPSTPHLLILAGYPFDYDPFLWADRNLWEGWARGVPGWPRMPPGWDHWDAWQFTSSGQVPGMPSLIDCSLVTDDAFAQSAGGGDGYTDMEKDVLRGLGVDIDRLGA